MDEDLCVRESSNIHYLGIDLGSVALSIVLSSTSNVIERSEYRLYEGDPRGCLRKLLEKLDFDGICYVAGTGASQTMLGHIERVDPHIAIQDATRILHPGSRTLLYIGGERYGCIHFDMEGQIAGLETNSSCAAGSGSFLDQQARRLNLEDSAQLDSLARNATGEPPKIASRCAVFAKTDIIHAQQEGHSVEDICAGLCVGLARNITDSLFSTRNPNPPIALTGGVAQNRAVVRQLSSLLGQQLIVDEYSHLYGALGASLAAHTQSPGSSFWNCDEIVDIITAESVQHDYFFSPLNSSGETDIGTEKRDHYLFISNHLGAINPIEIDNYSTHGRYTDNPLPSDPAFIGIDIGSTSTKAMVVGADHAPIAGFYTLTAGKPLAAVQGLFEAIASYGDQHHIQFDIRGVATTGSGRMFVGKLVGSDLELDEISAHARAAAELDPKIDTIIEIGGQDSKFTTLRRGMVTFAQMNTVCAAGTGSFLEEQAAKLGVSIDAYNKRATGAASPLVSDRCTVFMERDINYFLNHDY